MAKLEGQSIAASYDQLLHVDTEGGGNTTTHVSVKDGDNGTTFALTLATDAVMITSTNRLEFGDDGTYIHQSADGVLDLVSDTEIEINATTIDINGAVAMDGAITGATDITLSGELDAATLDISGNADIDGTTNLDIVDIDGAVDMASTLQLDGTLTVSADDTGADVRIYSATASEGLLYDASEDELGLLLTTKLKFYDIGGGEEIYASANGHLEVNAGTTLDITAPTVDINASTLVQIDGPISVGVDGTGHDVIFYGDTASSNMTWDEGEDDLVLNDSRLFINQDDNVSAIVIDSESTNTEVVNIGGEATLTGTILGVYGGALTTGTAGLFYDSATNTSTRSIVKIVNDAAAATGATCLQIQQDSTGKAISATGGIVEEGGVLKENLLTNSGFDVWSNSTLESASDKVTNGDFDSGDTGWTKGTGWTIADQGGGDFEGVATNNEAWLYQTQSITVGKLYRVTVTCSDYTDGSVAAFMYGGVAGAVYASALTETGTSTLVFEAVDSTIYIGAATRTAASNLRVDDITFDEVTPGTVAADQLGPDGWLKDTTLDLHREHNDGGTNTYDGSFYSLKMTPSAVNDFMYWPKGLWSTDFSYQRFAGRTVTFGAWVKTSTPSHAFLQIRDSDTTSLDQSSDSTSYHTGGGGWEWLEVTSTISASTTVFAVYVVFDQSAGVTYLSQPMLVFGSSIGEGNYTRPQGEWVYTTRKHLTGFSGDSFSDASAQDINLEASSDGVIPKGAKAIMCRLQARDSDTATGSPYFWLMGHDVNAPQLEADCTFADAAGRDDMYSKANGIVPCNADGDISYYAGASGSNTLDVFITVYAVQLR